MNINRWNIETSTWLAETTAKPVISSCSFRPCQPIMKLKPCVWNRMCGRSTSFALFELIDRLTRHYLNCTCTTCAYSKSKPHHICAFDALLVDYFRPPTTPPLHHHDQLDGPDMWAVLCAPMENESQSVPRTARQELLPTFPSSLAVGWPVVETLVLFGSRSAQCGRRHCEGAMLLCGQRGHGGERLGCEVDWEIP